MNQDMKKQVQAVSWLDGWAVPVMLILSYILGGWLSAPAAVAVSVLLVLFLLYLSEPRRMRFKKFMIVTLLITAISYILVTLFELIL